MADHESGHGNGSEPTEIQGQPGKDESQQGSNPSHWSRIYQFLEYKFRQANEYIRAAQIHKKFQDATQRGYFFVLSHGQRCYVRSERWLEHYGTVVSDSIDVAVDRTRSGMHRFWRWFWRPNRIVCLATVVMAATSGFQWLAIENTNEEMVAQREEMARQTKALIDSNTLIGTQGAELVNQTKEMVRQNDLMQAQFDRYMSDQRAILAGAQVIMERPERGKPVKVAISLVNAGKSAAVIEFDASITFVSKGVTEIDAVLALYSEQLESSNRRTYVPVGQHNTFHGSTQLSDEAMTWFEDEVGELYVVHIIRYDDGAGGMQRVGFCYQYNRDAGKLFAHSERGYVDNWEQYKQEYPRLQARLADTLRLFQWLKTIGPLKIFP